MLGKIKTLTWYLSKPSYWGDLALKIKARLINAEKENTEDEALAWCRSLVEDIPVVFEKLFPGKPYYNVQETFPDVFTYAYKQQEDCPFKMGGPGCIDFLYSTIRASGGKKLMETGVAYGWSSLAMLLAIDNVENGALISVDMPYAKMGNQDFVGTVIPRSLRRNWTLFREPDVSGVPKAMLLLKQVDVCHYDSDKSYTGRMRSSRYIWKRLSRNAVFITDDINDNTGFRDFCREIGREPAIISWSEKYIGILIK